MFTNKKDLIKQVNWALRLREPLCCGEVKDVRSKWTSEGYEVRFDGGSAMIAHFAGRIVAIAWQQMGDVERHLFAKDCDELLHRDAKELGHFDIGYLGSLFHLLKDCDGDKRILMGQDVQFEDSPFCCTLGRAGERKGSPIGEPLRMRCVKCYFTMNFLPSWMTMPL